MLGLIVDADRRRSIIVSDRGPLEIRRFLKSRRIRPNRSHFVYPELTALNRGRAAFYELRGDANFLAQRDIPIRTTFGELAQAAVGMRSLQSVLYEPLQLQLDQPIKEVLEVIGVPCEAVVIAKGRGVV